MERTAHQRRYLRMKKSKILQDMYDNIDIPIIKWADTREELEQAFSLLHDGFLRAGFLQEPKRNSMLYNIHILLPGSHTLLIKNCREVVATLSMVEDDPMLGLPLDAVYHQELDALRRQGRKVCEICSLAVSSKLASGKLLLPLFRAMYWRALEDRIDDMCIMVNPKHATFYRTVLLFEDLGREKFLERVNAPAVALKASVLEYHGKLKEAYTGFESNSNVYDFFYSSHLTRVSQEEAAVCYMPAEPFDTALIRHFLEKDESINKSLSPEQLSYILEQQETEV
jgi:hypothetical protein